MTTTQLTTDNKAATITADFTHTIKDGIEQYTFPSALNNRQVHFIDRVDDGPWEISVVNFSESLSLDEARTLAKEVNELADFMAGLNA